METKKLTRKQQTFVETYLETGNGTEAAKKAYDIKENDELTPRVIASENLTKPNIVEAIKNGMKDNQINEAFDKLINLKRIDYFVFPSNFKDKDIEEHVTAQGIEVLNIRESERGKMAFYAVPDGKALGKALDIWAKLAGAYAPETHVNLNIQAKEISPRLQSLAKKLNGG